MISEAGRENKRGFPMERDKSEPVEFISYRIYAPNNTTLLVDKENR